MSGIANGPMKHTRTVASSLILCRQVAQFLRIAYHVERTDHSPVDLERCRLHHSLGCVHDSAGQAVDGRKAHREVRAPPLTRAGARGLHDEARHTFGAFDHLSRSPYLAAAVDHDTRVARKELRQCIDITR